MTRATEGLIVAGLSVRPSARTSSALADLKAALGAASPAVAPADLLLHSDPGRVTLPDRRPDRVVQHVAYWSEADHQVVATSRTQTARVSLGRAVLDPGTDGVRGLHMLLMPVLALLVAQRGMCLAHAAAFVDDPGAVMALGGSGRGKSTLITAALSAGHAVLSDDLVVLRLDADGVSLSGVPQPLALPADLEHELAVGAAIEGDPRDRRAPARDIVLDTGWHRLICVLFVEHSQELEGQLRPASGRDTFQGLLTSTLEGLSAGTARYAFPFAAAVAKVPAWHLGHAADPGSRVAAAARWIGQARPAPARGA